ncbi:hypothetical protein FKM82_003357 [Ascaphus truei]
MTSVSLPSTPTPWTVCGSYGLLLGIRLHSTLNRSAWNPRRAALMIIFSSAMAADRRSNVVLPHCWTSPPPAALCSSISTATPPFRRPASSPLTSSLLSPKEDTPPHPSNLEVPLHYPA